jgi:hypothetical protein
VAANPYDKGSRYAARLDPPGFWAWLLRGSPRVRFHSWLDTRTLPFPGEPDLTCDTVACLRDETAPDVWWAVPLEFLIRPDGTMFGRLLEYLGRLWREQRPVEAPTLRFHVAAAVVNLTGVGQTSRDMHLGTTLRTCLQVCERNLAAEDAGVTLADIAVGRVARCLLPFIPLMHGGCQVAMIEQWKQLALAEPDARRRGDYGGLALVFAEAAGCREAWRQGLKGWNMEQSMQVLEWISEGETKGELRNQRENLRLLLEHRFGPLPPAVLQRLEAATELERLRAAFRQALDLQRLEDLQL